MSYYLLSLFTMPCILHSILLTDQLIQISMVLLHGFSSKLSKTPRGKNYLLCATLSFPTVSWKMKILPVAPAGSRCRPIVWLCGPVVVNHSTYYGEAYGDDNIVANPQIPAEWLAFRQRSGWVIILHWNISRERTRTGNLQWAISASN